MTSYGEAAVTAARLYTSGRAESPKDAWLRAADQIFGAGTSSAQKGCPRNAFLGLCEEGLVKGVAGGQYTRSKKNKAYALEAVAILRQNPELAANPNVLWDVVMGNEEKRHNSQMHVVVGLWNEGLLVHRA